MTNRPTLTAYQVREYKDRDGNDKSSWTRVGVAFAHNKGNGFNIELDSVPLNGKIVLMPPKDDRS